MGQKLVVGPFNQGLKKDVEAFNIDNDNFPVLINAYQWRGRVKRKRGTSLLTRLKRAISSITLSVQANGASASYSDILNDASINLRTSQPNASIAPGTVRVTVGADSFTDSSTSNGTLVGTPGTNSGTINYATGAMTLSFSPALGGATNVVVSLLYNPVLPVMGIEEFVIPTSQFNGDIQFDTKYSYNVTSGSPTLTYDVSYYKNPESSGPYVRKTVWTPTSWNGQNYQQTWTTNYQGCMWTTNGITVPFTTANIGMQFASASTTPALSAVTRVSSTTMSFTVTGNPLIQGDFVFVNEFTASAGGDSNTINFQSGYVTTAGDTFVVTFPSANITAGNYANGMIQYLTNRSNITKDCLRWYDGDPTNGNEVTPGFVAGKGWVNFMPPLSQSSFSINDLPAAQYYLVGARMIFPFKNRLLFIGVVVQTSSGPPIYLQDTVVYSQNGTPFYTASFSGDVDSSATVFNAILVPGNQTATPTSYFADQTGFGGNAPAGINQPINTISSNEDVLIMGFNNLQARFVYTGNDLIPFVFYVINSELGSSSTFSAINTDSGVISRGDRGFIMSNQTQVSRIDLDIPDQVFESSLLNNGAERICSQRDFINEWMYFTYPKEGSVFPNQTLQYNYRDGSWAIFNEAYTTYGSYRKQTGLTWATVGSVYKTWAEWNTPWNSGSSNVLEPKILAGNSQGFVVIRDQGTSESVSLIIKNISGSVITSPNHCLTNGDYIMISGALGTIGTEINGKIYRIGQSSVNSFTTSPSLPAGTYLGNGLITRMYRPFIQTKQFPAAWGIGRKTRIGVQQYLLTTTQNSQIQLLIYLSQNSDNPYNDSPVIPDVSSNNSLLYSTVLYTCPESTNLGLTQSNINLQNPGAITQSQIWHRMNTSLIGDTIQLGFTLSDKQMTDVDINEKPISQFSEIELHGFILDITPSQLLS